MTTAKKALPPTWANLWAMPATTVMVSCVGREARPNIITIAACGVACATPPLISVAVGTRRYSRGLIRETGDFCVNVPSAEQAVLADWCGMVSGQAVDKFAGAGLTPGQSHRVSSPTILECPVSYECTLWKSVPCGSHDLLLGEVVQVHVSEDVLNAAREALDPAKSDPLVSLQLTYFGLGEKAGEWRFSRKR